MDSERERGGHEQMQRRQKNDPPPPLFFVFCEAHIPRESVPPDRV